MDFKVLCVVGARPNFMKIAPLLRAFRDHQPSIVARLVHTGQHYDYEMNAAFFEQLEIPHPAVTLDVGSASHAVQTAEIMRRFEPVLDAEQPDVVLVVGDVNSTIACALVAVKKQVRVVHVEAGLRSRDRSMPEEINRVLTDQISDRLYVTEPDAIANLVAEGIDPERIVFAGNVMIDNLFWSLERAVDPDQVLGEGGAGILDAEDGFGLVTLHRPSNVDEPEVLRRLVEALLEISVELPLVFPVHPRTRTKLEKTGLDVAMAEAPGLRVLEPLGFFELLGLMRQSRVVLTDSGGLQEETCALGIPCITLRDNTERPITLDAGTNTLVGNDPVAVKAAVARVLGNNLVAGGAPERWDGKAAERIVADLAAWLESQSTTQRSTETAAVQAGL